MCQEALLRYRQYMLELYGSMKEAEERKLVMGVGEVKNNAELIKGLQEMIVSSLPSPVVSP
jgi:hypothetical protein